jgi:hypothetical protein
MRSTLLLSMLAACKEDHEFTIKDETTGMADEIEGPETQTGTDAPPEALADAYTTDRDVALILEAASGVLANDTSASGAALTAVLITPPASGTLSLAGDGSFVYEPTPGFVGADSFVYHATDGTNASEPVTVAIEVVVPNDPPLVQDETYETPLEVPLLIEAPGVLANDTDPEGDLVAVVLVTGPTHGLLQLEVDGSFVYTPESGFEGFDTFVYEVNDGYNEAVQGTATLAVGDVSYPPEATDDTLLATSGVPRTIEVPGVLYNDSDPDGDPLTAVLDTPPANGTLELAPDGSFTYTSTEGFAGEDIFTYHASDGALDSSPATVTITVSLNTAPTGTDDSYGALSVLPLIVNPADGVLANDTDPNGDPLTAILLDDVSHGSLTLDADGSFTYDANLLFIGTDTFTYQAFDGLELSAPITVEIGVL